MEIERKYLVDKQKWEHASRGLRGKAIRQGYLASTPACVIRIRIAGEKAFLTVKGPKTGLTREEFEYRIPLEDARVMIGMSATPEIEKERYEVDYMGYTWEVDVFHGDNEGLVLAEVELDSESEDPERPEWIDAEVSGDRRYGNMALALHPINSWI